MQKLAATAVNQAKPKDKPYKLADGGGLYVHVKSTGKYWRYKYRFANKEKLLALGLYPETSLAVNRYHFLRHLTASVDNFLHTLQATADSWIYAVACCYKTLHYNRTHHSSPHLS